MFYPSLKAIKTGEENVEKFGGYNHNPVAGAGEFYEMENLSSDYYPVISPRPKRETVWNLSDDVTGTCRDAYAYVNGSKLFYQNKMYELGLSTSYDMMYKSVIRMGKYILIFPDAVYFNIDGETSGTLGAVFSSAESDSISFTPCTSDGSSYTATVSAAQPSDPANGAYWVDSSQSPNLLMRYSSNTGRWINVPSSYVKISCPGIGADFKDYDGVSLSGITASEAEELNGSHVIQKSASGYIIITGQINAAASQTGGLTVERKIPHMDHVTMGENRLWGCRYGMQNGVSVNEIYCCKLGDPFNWNCFMGIDTDSVIYSVGSAGAFTGAITYGGRPMFFKENCLHKIYGSIPTNFQIVTNELKGVESGGGRTLAIVNNVLYYKGVEGIMAYDGSMPVPASQALGDKSYDGVSAGRYRNKYYISMKEKTTGLYHLFVYDTSKGLWHREDNINAGGFVNHFDGDLCFINSGDKKLYRATNGTYGTKADSTVKWSAETGIMSYGYENKYISKLKIRLNLPQGSSVTLSVMYDSAGTWEHLFTVSGKNEKAFTIPVMPRRCDHFRLKINGCGDFKIYGISKVFESGE